MSEPSELVMKTMTCKVSVAAQDRLKLIAKQNKLKVQDVVSVCLLHMPESEIVRLVEELNAQYSSEARAMMRKLDKLTDEEKSVLRSLLS